MDIKNKLIGFARRKAQKTADFLGKFDLTAQADYSNVHKNVSLIDKHEGEVCFLLGCGPSLGAQDLKCLKGANIIGMSTSFYHNDYQDILPIANVFTGYAFHKHTSELIDYIETYKNIDKYAIGKLLFSEGDKDFIEENGLLKNREIYFYKADRKVESLFAAAPRLDKSIAYGQNIAVFTIQIAISLGFKKIYLLGLDHDWIFQLNKKTYTKFATDRDTTFKKSNVTDFDIPGQDLFGFWIDVYHTLWDQYRVLKKFAEANDIQIINLTEGGVLDVFKRDKLTNVLKTIRND